MSTPNPTLLDKSGTTDGEITFSLFGKALAASTSDVEPRVTVPQAVTDYLKAERNTFAAKTNRFKRTLTVSDDLARGILEYRPADLKLTGAKLREAGAKEFARQVRQFAADNKLSTAPRPHRQFRHLPAGQAAARPSLPPSVTVTQGTPAAA